MSGTCTIGTYGTYVDAGGFGGAAFVTRCACPNCTEREANVMAEANARRKALLALDQAMKDLAAPVHTREEVETYAGRTANAVDAWRAARRFILPGERPE